jgi:hypothetical protein
VYGIIFGASHPRAVDKFLKTAWERNHVNGEANFDIDDDANKNQLNLWEAKKMTKMENFAKLLRENILNDTIQTNKDAFDFTLKQGHIDSHAVAEVKKMKEEKLITYSGRTPLINYNQIYNNKRIVNFEILEK